MRIIALVLFLILAGSAEARQRRTVTIKIVRGLETGATCDIMVAPRGSTLQKVATATNSALTVTVPNLVVGRTYDFSSIVRKGTTRSVMPPPLHYTITRASYQLLWGYAPP